MEPRLTCLQRSSSLNAGTYKPNQVLIRNSVQTSWSAVPFVYQAMETEKFCLRWNDFETNISTAFKELREDKDFFDVTLACDDDQIQAHKVILSACSPFFKSILKRNSHPHPLIYLKGMRYTDLVAVLNFMYHGEVNVAQEELNTFLGIAEDLKIKGLSQNTTSKKEKDADNEEMVNRNVPKKNASPTIKKVKSLALTPSNTINAQYNDCQNDEIEEIIPVKTEPLDNFNTQNSTLATPAQINQSQAVAANQNIALVENNDNSALYGEDFGEYGDFSEAGEGYEQANESNLQI
jgi:hypothetical protein